MQREDDHRSRHGGPLAPGGIAEAIQEELDRLAGLQRDIERYAELVTNRGILAQVQDQLRYVQEARRGLSLPARDYLAAIEQAMAESTLPLRKLSASQVTGFAQLVNEMRLPFDQLSAAHLAASELSPQLQEVAALQDAFAGRMAELAGERLGGAASVSAAIDALWKPFDYGSVVELYTPLIPDFQTAEYLRLFNAASLQKVVLGFPVAEPDPEPEAEVAAQEEPDEVHLPGSLHIKLISAVSDALIEYLARHPEQMRELPPRQFEELVAELLAGFGFEVELTQQTRDGGRDIIAVSHGLFRTTHLIECRRYAPDRPIRVGQVRALLGVLVDERASQGVIVTTSYLTRDAKKVIERNRWQLEGKDFEALKAWVHEYLERKRREGA